MKSKIISICALGLLALLARPCPGFTANNSEGGLLLYRRLDAPPDQIVSALFSDMPAVAQNLSSSNSRLSALLKISMKRVGRSQVYFRVATLTAILPRFISEKSTAEVWVTGNRDRPGERFQFTVDSPVNGVFTGSFFLAREKDGSMLELRISPDDSKSIFLQACVKAAIAAGFAEGALPLAKEK